MIATPAQLKYRVVTVRNLAKQRVAIRLYRPLTDWD